MDPALVNTNLMDPALILRLDPALVLTSVNFPAKLSPSHIDKSTPATPPKLEISKSVSAAQLINDAEPVTEETIDQVAEEMNDQVLEAQPVAEQTLDQVIIPPPPEQSFASPDECLASIQSWSKIYGFAIAKRSSYQVNKEGRIMYQCDKSGHYRPHCPNKQETAEDEETKGPDPKPQEDTTQKPKNGLPNTSTSPKQKVKMPPKNTNKTRKTNCPFRATATHNSSTNMWDLEIRNPEHNHGPSDHPTAHLIHRRFTPAQKKEVTKWAEAGVMPLKVKNGMMQDTTTPLYANLRSFHNLNYRERQKSQLELPRKTKESTLPESLALAKNHPSCLLIDATYKTNRYKMLLLHITGVNATDKSFTVAFCFINTEKDIDFTWELEQLALVLQPHSPSVILTDKEQALMSAIEVVFPSSQNLLCQWHIGKNLWSHCRPLLGEEPYLAFLMGYMDKNWIPLADRFVKYLISDVLHFKNVNTSRVESLHAAIERFLKGANSSMPTTISDMHDALRHQLRKLLIDCATQKQVHINKLPQKSSDCPEHCKYESYMGMPCSHRMQRLEVEGKSLEAKDFHPQWHLPDIPADTLLPPLSQAKSDSDEDYEKRFLREILERFQTLPTHEKLGYI
ncbi:hypothetical protein PSTG_16285 [Puccinia striiformis f. sp. tritici PST-78]|uniref:MULE transposase domain-containing protein n=1 Tax=Puccinia striiformis f. sp. tritici PST-78 TaxID=1165861 RepID=A0A0L0UTC0_9BASI|nr:hypothetical protein PSTG_16285 [Puccinia striiformis f. sp. tritici PST-78]